MYFLNKTTAATVAVIESQLTPDEVFELVVPLTGTSQVYNPELNFITIPNEMLCAGS